MHDVDSTLADRTVPWARITADDGTLLRRPLPADAPGVHAVHGDPEVYRFDPQETHPDVEHTARFLSPMLAHWGDHGFGYWTVLVPREVWPDGVAGGGDDDAGRVIAGLGGIQHREVDGEPALNVYYRFAPVTQGRGLAGLVIRHALETAAIVAPGRDVVVRTRPANAAARHVAERAGFVDEGLEPGTDDMQLLRYRA